MAENKKTEATPDLEEENVFFDVEKDEDASTIDNDDAQPDPDEDKVDQPKLGRFMKIAEKLADEVSKNAFRSNDEWRVKKDLMKIFTVVCAISALKKDEDTIRVGKELYRVYEYKMPTAFSELIAPRQVIARDVMTAVDFLDRKAYVYSKDNLVTPAELTRLVRNVCSKMRVNPKSDSVSRDDSWLLSEATKYAVTGMRVADKASTKLCFLNTLFDYEALISIDEWSRTMGNHIYNSLAGCKEA